MFWSSMSLSLSLMEESYVSVLHSSAARSSLMNSEFPSSSSSSPRHQGQLQRQHQENQEDEQPNPSYRVSISVRPDASSSTSETRDDIWSCLVILLTFCFFASMTLILGFYGSADLQLGPNASRLLQTNSFFVQDLKVKAIAKPKHGTVMLHGFHSSPALDVWTTWSESHKVSIPADFHKEWIYYLNKNAQISISYSLKSEASQPLILIISKGKESLSQWIEDPLYPNTTLSWNLMHGNGTIQLNVVEPSNYYIAVGNINHKELEVKKLDFRFQNLLYNTSQAYYKCSLDNIVCILKLFFLGTNIAVLTTSGSEQTYEDDDWYLSLSYGPRWISYLVSSGTMTLVILLCFKIFANPRYISRDNSQQTAEVITNRTSLLPNKDDDNLSLGSSYDSVSHDEEDLEECHGITKKLPKVGEADTSCSLCAVCCDAQKDCFFLPCGHSATCFTCGARIAGEAGVCPICRRQMKKVRKIFTV